MEKFSWVNWETSLFSHFSLVWKVTLIFIPTLAKSDTQSEPMLACIKEKMKEAVTGVTGKRIFTDQLV